MANNISFMRFLDFQDSIPDSMTIWLFRERLKEKDLLDAIWQELQRQMDAKGLTVKEGCIRMLLSSLQTQANRATSLEVMSC